MTATGPQSTSGTCHVSFVIIIVTTIMTTLYTRHIYFMDLAKYGCDVKYINMVSDRMPRVTCVTCVTCNVAGEEPAAEVRVPIPLQQRGDQRGQGGQDEASVSLHSSYS